MISKAKLFLAKDNFYKNSSNGFDRLGYATTSKFSIERRRKLKKIKESQYFHNHIVKYVHSTRRFLGFSNLSKSSKSSKSESQNYLVGDN